MSGKCEGASIRADFVLHSCLIGAAVLMAIALLAQPAAGEGVSDGPVLALPAGTTPEKVASTFRRERLDPEEATVASQVIDEEGRRRYTIACPLPRGDERGKTYTITTYSYLRPAEFRRRLYGRD